MAKKYDTVQKVEDKVWDLVCKEEAELNVADRYIRIQEGNSKLQGILNFSITPVLTCPYSTELCVTNCYAVKSYIMNRSTVVKSHLANWKVTQQDNFVELMIAEIERQLARPKYSGKHVEFRIHVSGDFYSYDYLVKWIAITDHFRGRNISFGCYTKSITYIRSYLKNTGYTLSSININFMFSIWADTKAKFINLADELQMNTFSAYDAKHEEQPANTIRCQDDVEEKACGRTCNLCYEKDSQQLLTDKWNDIIDQALGRKHVVIGIH
jgi:hypothetical protein